jgi:hypothetical protein
MRDLTGQEIDLALDDNSEAENGCIAIEATLGELALKGTGTSCGHLGNTAFISVALMFSDNAMRLVRGWYDPKDNTMCGMIHIQCDNEELADCISEAAGGNGGSLRPDGPSLWEGFWEFENE